MMKHSETRILLCDSSKLGKKALLQLTELSTPDYVVMDEVPEADPELVRILGSRLITDKNQLK